MTRLTIARGWARFSRGWGMTGTFMSVSIARPTSPECEGQRPRPEGDGCHSEEMDRWSNNIVLEHSMPRAGPKMSNLPAACWEVLNAP